MGLPWHPGVSWMREAVLCLRPGRSRQGLKLLFGPQTANGSNEAAIDGKISTEANEGFLLHVREVDVPTPSPECSQPFQQSVRRVFRATPTPPEPINNKDFRDIASRPPTPCRMVASQALAECFGGGLDVYRHSADRVRLQDESARELS